MPRFNDCYDEAATVYVCDTRAACRGLLAVLVSLSASLSALYAVAPTLLPALEHQKNKSFDIYTLPGKQRVDGLGLVAVRVLQGFNTGIPSKTHLHELRDSL